MAKLPKKKKPLKKTKAVDIKEGKLKVGEQDVTINDPEVQDGDTMTALRKSLQETKKQSNLATVGLSMGVTLNVGDYQSARVDLFISRNVPDNEKSIDKAIDEISTKILAEIENQTAQLLGDE
jgi:hypothetical protein